MGNAVYMKNNKCKKGVFREYTLLGCLIAAGTILRLWCFSLNSANCTPIYADEAWYKIWVALEWCRWNQGVDLSVGLLHTYIISFLWYISQSNIVFLSRCISFIFGCAFILVYYELLKEAFYNVRVARWGTLLLIIYPLHVQLCTVSLPEVIAYFLLFSSLYFLYRYFYNQKITYFVIASVTLTLAGMLRFECWLFILFYSMLIFRHRKRFWPAVLFFSISSVYPLAFLQMCFINFGRHFYIMEKRAMFGINNMLREMNLSFLDRLIGFPQALMMTVSTSVLCACIIGCGIYVIHNRRIGVFLGLFLSVMCIFIYKSLLGTYDYHVLRYSILPGLLLLPYGGYLFERVYDKAKKIKVLWVVLIVLFSLCAHETFAMQIKYFADPHARISPSLKKTITWITHHMQQDEKILLEYGMAHPYIIIAADLSPSQLVYYDDRKFWCDAYAIRKAVFQSHFVVVSKKEGRFKNVIPQLISDGRGNRVFISYEWEIYKIIK